MVYGLLRALPGDRLSCHRRRRKSADLTPAPRRQDHTSSPSAPARVRLARALASTASHRAFRDVRNAPLVGWDGPIQAGDLPDKESEIFFIRGLVMISVNRKSIYPPAKLRHRRSGHKYNLCQTTIPR